MEANRQLLETANELYRILSLLMGDDSIPDAEIIEVLEKAKDTLHLVMSGDEDSLVTALNDIRVRVDIACELLAEIKQGIDGSGH
jgi:hypothetical protein